MREAVVQLAERRGIAIVTNENGYGRGRDHLGRSVPAHGARGECLPDPRSHGDEQDSAVAHDDELGSASFTAWRQHGIISMPVARREGSRRRRDPPARPDARRCRMSASDCSSLASRHRARAAACDNKKQPPVAAHSPLADSADQVMFGAQIQPHRQRASRARASCGHRLFLRRQHAHRARKVNTTFFTTTGARTRI